MIDKLQHCQSSVAADIYQVFQNSYKIEADLIEAEVFPPLLRRASDIQSSSGLFYGFFEQNELAAVVELSQQSNTIEIDSFTVEPAHFRKGIGRKLLEHVLNELGAEFVTVETATANLPAIALYEKSGFIETKRWMPSYGIEKVAFEWKK